MSLKATNIQIYKVVYLFNVLVLAYLSNFREAAQWTAGAKLSCSSNWNCFKVQPRLHLNRIWCLLQSDGCLACFVVFNSSCCSQWMTNVTFWRISMCCFFFSKVCCLIWVTPRVEGLRKNCDCCYLDITKVGSCWNFWKLEVTIGVASWVGNFRLCFLCIGYGEKFSCLTLYN